MLADPERIIQQCRTKFGSAPRNLTREERSYFRLRRGFLQRVVTWLLRDRLNTIIQDQKILRDHGRVVWGCLVQANQALFNAQNRETLPAALIYSPDTYFDDNVSDLNDLAHNLFELKGRSPDDLALQKFSAAITDELTRIMRLAIPRKYCYEKTVFFTTCYIQPSHLPKGYLVTGYFPLIICPEKTVAVMPLPSRYWPEELIYEWASE